MGDQITARKHFTLVFPIKDGKVLLGLKKRGFGIGKWNGFGGKVEKLETLEHAAKRELFEESMIIADEVIRSGYIEFEFLDETTLLCVHIFVTHKFHGNPEETEEMEPKWYLFKDIPYENMWADDILWYPILFEGQLFKGYFNFTGHDTITSHQLDICNSLPSPVCLMGQKPALGLQGAEARIYQGSLWSTPVIIKERFKKNYRHPSLDTSLSKNRMKAEVRMMARARSIGVRTPTIYQVDYEGRKIYMEWFQNSSTLGKVIDSCIESKGDAELKQMMVKMAQIIANLHANNIIHGDLTTSNLLVDKTSKELILIDFGLSYMHNQSIVEDEAVDLYVLERAFLSSHPSIIDHFKSFLKYYQQFHEGNGNQVISKLEEVRARGRKRDMIG